MREMMCSTLVVRQGRPAALFEVAAGMAILMVGSILAGPALAASQHKAPKPDTSGSETTKIEIRAQPLGGFDKTSYSRTSFGKLEFLGGLVLSSSDARFGGWSGLAMDADGSKLVAVSDAGTWLTADLAYRASRPEGLKNARLGPIKAKNGGRLRRDRDRDAEAVLLLSGSVSRGQLLISFEQNHRLGLFSVNSDGVTPPSRYLGIPSDARRMRALKGFEAVAQIKSGRYKGGFVALAEHLMDGGGNHSGWIVAGGKSLRFAMTDIGGFDPTDAVSLDNGDLIVLERRFRWLEGVKMRLRRVSVDELKPGAVVKGDVLLEADMTDEIDNMEAISAHKDARGRTVLTLMSDDNFNGFLQRTLLLQFRLDDETKPHQARR